VLLKIAIKELLMGKLETFFKDKLGLMFDSCPLRQPYSFEMRSRVSWSEDEFELK
jgi:hypothetical protein